MELYIEKHLQWRLLTECDWDEVVALRAQMAALDDSVMPAIDRAFGSTQLEIEQGDAIGGWDAYGSLLAFGWNLRQPGDDELRIFLIGGVHPTHRYQGIGKAVLDWQIAQAISWRDEHCPQQKLWLGCYVEDIQPGLQRLLERHDFQVERYFFDMHRNLDQLPKPVEVAGITFVPFDIAMSPQVLALHNECFTSQISADTWESSLNADTFRSDWSWLALHDGELVGYCLSGTDDASGLDGVMEGWCDRLGVSAGYRHQGIAQSLLARTMHSMANSGCPAAGIGVDTPHPGVATWLTKTLGYEVRDGVTLMTKQLPPAVS